jgi:hypothetical protein
LSRTSTRGHAATAALVITGFLRGDNDLDGTDISTSVSIGRTVKAGVLRARGVCTITVLVHAVSGDLFGIRVHPGSGIVAVDQRQIDGCLPFIGAVFIHRLHHVQGSIAVPICIHIAVLDAITVGIKLISDDIHPTRVHILAIVIAVGIRCVSTADPVSVAVQGL